MSQAVSIALKNLKFGYSAGADQVVVDLPDWSTKQGEHIFLHGPSGSGKSTLLNLLSGILPSNQGEITLIGQRIDTMSARRRDQFRANNIGYIFQQFNLIDYLSAIDNIRLAQRFCQSDKSNDLKAIHKLLDTLNIGKDDRNKKTAQLSIGQQQRIAIARALINNPAILIADEPTSSLDQANQESFMSLLMSQARSLDMTVIFVSHDLSLASHFSRVESLVEINRAGVA